MVKTLSMVACQLLPALVSFTRLDLIARMAIGGYDKAGRALAPEGALTLLVRSISGVIASRSKVSSFLALIVVAFVLADTLASTALQLDLVIAVFALASVAL